MNKTVAGVIVAAVAIIGVGGAVLLANQNDGDPTTSGEHSSTEQSDQKQSNVDTSKDTENNTQGQAVQTTSIDIKDYAYAPAKTQVKKGTAITWTNQDSVRHDVSADNESDDFKSGELLAKGESYTFTFNKVGTYTYHCSPHPYMKGTVEVVE